MNSRNRLLAAGLLSASCLPLGGCLVSGSSTEEMSGQFVGRSTFMEIEPGVTTEKWILTALGEPTTKACMDDGTSLWKWAYRRARSSSSSVFLVFGGSSLHETEGATFVQLKDGIVTKAWQE